MVRPEQEPETESGPLALEFIYFRRFCRGALKWSGAILAAFVGLELVVNSSVPALGFLLIVVSAALAMRARGQHRFLSRQRTHRIGRDEMSR